eukprot:CAMPEP_0178857016 /NCGR_PEP_ID=MMETSP0746-20121128/24243_1 /TAXON_ID=913974 /ORGANISM="Nitzschia punctata, Strain CCMP561" /LENGTH=240 /DNA_ID=CAMNT_0020523245 /DNA_START=63 /DNA_END=785 /DNA_ORIENTATION=-
MKISMSLIILAANTWTFAEGFSTVLYRQHSTTTPPPPPPATICRTTLTTRRRVTSEVSSATTEESTETSDFGSAMPEVDPHDIIGVEPEKLALGIDPDEFLEWVGTKQELMNKFQSDNPSFSPERVEEEVDRFMMDAESVNMYIKYLKERKLNPQKFAAEALEAELSLSNPKTAATYAAWLIGGLSFGYIKSEIIEPKFASGEWQLNLPFLSKPDSAVEAVSSVSQAVDQVIQQSTDSLS